MGRYDGIKNPDWTDEEFEEWEEKIRLEARIELATRDEFATGTFLGYFGCPKCNYRHELLRPRQFQDIAIHCECGSDWLIPLLHKRIGAS